METGFRHTATRQVRIPRDIITTFVCTYNGEEIFRADAVSGDRRQPVHHLLTPSRPRAARFAFQWTGDKGFSATASATITVE